MNATRPPESRLLIGAVAMKAVALVARRFPAFNGFYINGKFEPSSGVHLGMAIAIRDRHSGWWFGCARNS
jgi:pyruvate dehydrogenase E2 component (dihydrolipoamide acetyltransferase)